MAYVAPEFEAANALTREIIEFLISCGGPYGSFASADEVPRLLSGTILLSIASGQYILRRNASGEIEHYLCWWKIHTENVHEVEEGRIPGDIRTGSIVYVAEHGSTAGAASMNEVRRELRQRNDGYEGVFWNSRGNGNRFFMRRKR